MIKLVFVALLSIVVSGCGVEDKLNIAKVVAM